MTGVLAVIAGGGGGAETHTLVNGYSPGSKYFPDQYGYYSVLSLGSLTPTTSTLLGATISSVAWSAYPDQSLVFGLSAIHANSGWSKITVNGTTYTRASATYASGSGSTTWVWNEPVNPLPTPGASYKVVIQ